MWKQEVAMSIERLRAPDLQREANFAMTPAGKASGRRNVEAEVRRPSAESVAALPSGRTRKRDAARAQRLRTVIRYMLERGTLAAGDQVRLATHFGLSRQRVNQVVMLERELMKRALAETEDRSPMTGRNPSSAESVEDPTAEEVGALRPLSRRTA
jgi:hypothetical protein